MTDDLVRVSFTWTEKPKYAGGAVEFSVNLFDPMLEPIDGEDTNPQVYFNSNLPCPYRDVYNHTDGDPLTVYTGLIEYCGFSPFDYKTAELADALYVAFLNAHDAAWQFAVGSQCPELIETGTLYYFSYRVRPCTGTRCGRRTTMPDGSPIERPASMAFAWIQQDGITDFDCPLINGDSLGTFFGFAGLGDPRPPILLSRLCVPTDSLDFTPRHHNTCNSESCGMVPTECLDRDGDRYYDVSQPAPLFGSFPDCDDDPVTGPVVQDGNYDPALGLCTAPFPCQLTETCDNHKDDDCNGQSDCDDWKCATEHPCCGEEGDRCCSTGDPCLVEGLTCDASEYCALPPPTDPTCFDGIRNQGEVKIDCGEVCANLGDQYCPYGPGSNGRYCGDPDRQQDPNSVYVCTDGQWMFSESCGNLGCHRASPCFLDDCNPPAICDDGKCESVKGENCANCPFDCRVAPPLNNKASVGDDEVLLSWQAVDCGHRYRVKVCSQSDMDPHSCITCVGDPSGTCEVDQIGVREIPIGFDLLAKSNTWYWQASAIALPETSGWGGWSAQGTFTLPDEPVDAGTDGCTDACTPGPTTCGQDPAKVYACLNINGCYEWKTLDCVDPWFVCSSASGTCNKACGSSGQVCCSANSPSLCRPGLGLTCVGGVCANQGGSGGSGGSGTGGSGGSSCQHECFAPGTWQCNSETEEYNCIKLGGCNQKVSVSPCGVGKACVPNLGCRPCGGSGEPCCVGATCTGGGVCQGDGKCGHTSACPDTDGDGFQDKSCGGTDCDDTVWAIHPGGVELCNGKDDDCDGETDEGSPGGNVYCDTGKLGLCKNGHTACSNGNVVCIQNQLPSLELCNGEDDDCDGAVDDGFDLSSDPMNCGACGHECLSFQWCSAGACLSPEICNGQDDDGDGVVDNGNPGGGGPCQTGQPGACASGTDYCGPGTNGSYDCVPSHTPTLETCNGEDDDCNGLVDDGDAGGGASCDTGNLGVCAAGTTACVGGSVVCIENLPATPEICDGQDNDCDGTTDEGVLLTFFRDADGDGYGNPLVTTVGCTAPPGFVGTGGDCDDTKNVVHPGVPEVCDGVDNNCVGGVDEGCACTNGATRACYTGSTGTENVGACHGGTQTCAAGAWGSCIGQVAPIAEACNGSDDDCDGATDDGFECVFGTNEACSTACGTGTRTCSGSCAWSACTLPTETTCDSIDDDCSGVIDDVATCPDCVLVELSLPAWSEPIEYRRDWTCAGPNTWETGPSPYPTSTFSVVVGPNRLYRLNACPCIGNASCSTCMASEPQDGAPAWGPPGKPVVTMNGNPVAVADFDPNRKIIPAGTCALVHDSRECTPSWTANLVCTPGPQAAEWDCTNGVDDDGDGMADCLDIDCHGNRRGSGTYCGTCD